MGVLDLPQASIKQSADYLEALVALQNWCAADFPYVCLGEKKRGPQGECICECGVTRVQDGSLQSNNLKEPKA